MEGCLKKYEENFKSTAFKGLRNSRDKFQDKLIEQYNKCNEAPTLDGITLETLRDREEILLGKDTQKLDKSCHILMNYKYVRKILFGKTLY